MHDSINQVIAKLSWMKAKYIWPNGRRYLWTDAFGVVLLASLYERTGEESFLRRAEWVVGEVNRILRRPKGIRIGEAPDRDGQYFHYLAMWIYALTRLGESRPEYRDEALALVHEIHPHFVIPGIGVVWKMRENLAGPYPGFGFGALDAFHGYTVYRLLDEDGLAREISDMAELIEDSYRDLHIDQDLGLGMMLWMTHFFPQEPWAQLHRKRSLRMLDTMWVDPPGYFSRQPDVRKVKFAFTNYGVSIGLQSVDAWPDRVAKLNAYFADYQSHDEYDWDAITHVMACASWYPGLLITNAAQRRARIEESSTALRP